MPITPVPDYDGARYPTLDDAAAERRAFLRQVGLAAIAAAFGGAATGCTAEGGNEGETGSTPTPPPRTAAAGPTPPVMLAGTPAPPRWPGPRGALVGGRSIEVTYADGSRGHVALAAVFLSDNTALENALIDAEPAIADAARARLKSEPPAFDGDPARVAKIEAALLDAIRKIVAVPGLQSVSIAKVAIGVTRAEAPAPAPAEARAAAMAPASALPAAPVPMPTMAPPVPRHLPRAGAKCPIHGDGCKESAHGG